MSKYDELYTLRKKRDEAIDQLWHEAYNAPIFLNFWKHKKKINGIVADLNSAKQDFNALFYDVLLSSHGISKDDIIGVSDGERLRVLINRTEREVTVKPVGRRLVFFIDGIALKENEKASSLRFAIRQLIG